MSEQELLAFARSVTSNEVTWFGQVITINFAVVVGIYYSLNRAQIALKLFASRVTQAYLDVNASWLGDLTTACSTALSGS